MQEKDLVELWNDKRRQIISATDALRDCTCCHHRCRHDGLLRWSKHVCNLLCCRFLVSVGSLSVLNQFAVIREAASIVNDLKALDNLSGVARDIASSGSYLRYTQVLMALFSLALLVALALLVL